MRIADTPVADFRGLNEFPKHTQYRGLTMSWHSSESANNNKRCSCGHKGLLCDKAFLGSFSFHNSAISISSAVLQMRKWGSRMND